MLKLRKKRRVNMQSCPECNTYMQSHEFNGKQYYNCTKCGKEIIVEAERTVEEGMSERTVEEGMSERTVEEGMITENEDDRNITEEYNRKEKIRNILTPDVIACQKCIDDYRVEISCSKCDIVMLKPDYNGKIYECPICGKLYCENCWDKTE